MQLTSKEMRQIFGRPFAVIGMVHLKPLPGSPAYEGSMDPIIEAAEADAQALSDGGVAAILIENFGDVPFFPQQVPAETVAAMTAVAKHLKSKIPLPLGINVLRNDGYAALAIAHAVGAAFIRVNVLASAMITDQGIIQGRAHDLMRLRRSINAAVKVFADLRVKHAAPLYDVPLVREAVELRERALADAIICTGETTGSEPDVDLLRRLRESLPDVPLIAGSGVTPENVQPIAEVADAAIVGTYFKHEGKVSRRVDRQRVTALMNKLNIQVG